MTKTLTEQQIRKILDNGTGKAAKVCEKKFYGKPKSLTEQWREGTLQRGYYYYKTKVGAKVIGYQCFGLKFPYDYYHNTIESVKEVLEPVPNYDKWQSYDKCADMLIDVNKKWLQTIVENKKLKKRLAIATKALKEYMTFCRHPAEEALKEMEGVK